MSRFIVSQVTGFQIRPGSSHGSRTRDAAPTSFYVLDRAFAHRVVAAFEPNNPHLRGNLGRKRLAEERAAELNAWASIPPA